MVRVAEERFTPFKLSEFRFAPVRFADGPNKYPPNTCHPLGSVGVPVKLCETTLVRVAEERFTPFKLSEFRFAPVRFADGPNKYPPNTCHPLGSVGVPVRVPDLMFVSVVKVRFALVKLTPDKFPFDRSALPKFTLLPTKYPFTMAQPLGRL